MTLIGLLMKTLKTRILDLKYWMSQILNHLQLNTDKIEVIIIIGPGTHNANTCKCKQLLCHFSVELLVKNYTATDVLKSDMKSFWPQQLTLRGYQTKYYRA